ncbi:YALI0D05687p KAB8284608.1 6-O-methylguanine DNA methyltransferase [Limtongia smithiae]|uniref:YALI0D05687p KAB8284608.1 6-O-methylguanine DNA methyltransferase n=1 Tax=Limtongia smithiae TaxID=1125753 RepID=UPI0034CF076D
MPKLSDEAESFYISVYEMVQRVPVGHVTTYGHIARMIGAPQNSRQVGSALKYLRAGNHNEGEDGAATTLVEFNSESVPWWRVISSDGRIAFRARESMDRQGQRLQAEGIEVRGDSNNRPRIISLSDYGWFPRADDDDDDEIYESIPSANVL